MYSGTPAWFLSVSSAPPFRSPGDRQSPAESYGLGFPGAPLGVPGHFLPPHGPPSGPVGPSVRYPGCFPPPGRAAWPLAGTSTFLLVLPWNSFRTFLGLSSWRPWNSPAGLSRRRLPCGPGSAARGPVLGLQGMPVPASYLLIVILVHHCCLLPPLAGSTTGSPCPGRYHPALPCVIWRPVFWFPRLLSTIGFLPASPSEQALVGHSRNRPSAGHFLPSDISLFWWTSAVTDVCPVGGSQLVLPSLG